MAIIITREDIDPEEPEPDGGDPVPDPRGTEPAGPQTDENGDAYQVGYGCPPRRSQFQLGNKRGKGRAKGSKNIKTIVNQALGSKAPARIDGQIKKLAKIELAMHQLANQAAGGNLKAIETSISLYDRHGPQEDPAGPSREQTKSNLATLRDYLELWDLFPEEDDGVEA